MRALDETEARRLLDAAQAEPLFALFHTAVTTGARLGELLALRWQDVDFNQRRATISRSVRRFADRGYIFGPTKTHRSRRQSARRKEVRVPQNRAALERADGCPAYADQDCLRPATGGVIASRRWTKFTESADGGRGARIPTSVYCCHLDAQGRRQFKVVSTVGLLQSHSRSPLLDALGHCQRDGAERCEVIR